MSYTHNNPRPQLACCASEWQTALSLVAAALLRKDAEPGVTADGIAGLFKALSLEITELKQLAALEAEKISEQLS